MAFVSATTAEYFDKRGLIEGIPTTTSCPTTWIDQSDALIAASSIGVVGNRSARWSLDEASCRRTNSDDQIGRSSVAA
jgi:hypothetical protein